MQDLATFHPPSSHNSACCRHHLSDCSSFLPADTQACSLAVTEMSLLRVCTGNANHCLLKHLCSWFRQDCLILHIHAFSCPVGSRLLHPESTAFAQPMPDVTSKCKCTSVTSNTKPLHSSPQAHRRKAVWCGVTTRAVLHQVGWGSIVGCAGSQTITAPRRKAQQDGEGHFAFAVPKLVHL